MPRRNFRLFGRLPSRLPAAWRMGVAGCVLALLTAQQGCRAEQPWPLWQHYCARFLEPSGRIVDHTGNDRSTSEGQAYGMFFALVANDRPTFDRLLRWTEDNLASGDLTANLPAWEWGRTAAGAWKPMDTNSAADADLWLAYDCMEAGRLWKDERLAKLGAMLAERVEHTEVATVPGIGTVLLPGPEGFHQETAGYVLNLSYSPPQVLARLRLEQPAGPWSAMARSLPALVAAGAPAGFATDWLRTNPAIGPSAAPALLAQAAPEASAVGSYDAIRLYLWLGMAEPSTPGVREEIAAVSGMARYLDGNVLPPLQVKADGHVIQTDGPVGFSAAVLPYLVASGHKRGAGRQADRLAASLQADSGLYGRSANYYDQNLALFATGWSERRFRFDREGCLELRWHG